MKQKITLISALIVQIVIILLAIRFAGHFDSLCLYFKVLLILIGSVVITFAVLSICRLMRWRIFFVLSAVNLMVLLIFQIYHHSYNSHIESRVLLFGLNGEKDERLINFFECNQIDSIKILNLMTDSAVKVADIKDFEKKLLQIQKYNSYENEMMKILFDHEINIYCHDFKTGTMICAGLFVYYRSQFFIMDEKFHENYFEF